MGDDPKTPSFFGIKIGGMKPYLGGTRADHGVQLGARMEEGAHPDDGRSSSDIRLYLCAACFVT